MARVFISFLGIGPEEEGYDSLVYYYGNRPVGTQTEFVQRAAIEALGPESIDKVVILCTHQSFSDFYHELRDELIDDLNMDEERIQYETIPVKLDKENQWALFSLVNSLIGNQDRLIFDFTHGFRLLPIILSAAIGFIQTIKPEVILEHVFYGQKENDTEGALIEMRDFYVINDWAQGVDHLVTGADISRLVSLASEEENKTPFSGLADENLITALNDLTQAIKDVHANEIGPRTHAALDMVQQLKDKAGPEEKELFQVILNKFKPIATNASDNTFYDSSYLSIQLEFARLLVRHGLFMQAFTVMRELIASIGMTGCTGKYSGKQINSNLGIKYRKRFGEIFVTLCQNPRKDWHYTDEKKRVAMNPEIIKDFNHILPFYDTLEEKGIADILQSFVKEMADYRNGFDHAWTGKSDVKQGVSEKAEEYLIKIEQVLTMLKNLRIAR